jgi:hypothetical protein
MEQLYESNLSYLHATRMKLQNSIALYRMCEKKDWETRTVLKHNILHLMNSLECTRVMLDWAKDFPYDAITFQV